MTKEDIVRTAFRVWGRDLYRTTSLSEIARELGVSKPALYRHFKDKDAILDAMDTVFFDNCAAFIKESYHRAISSKDRKESGLAMMRTVSEYYIRNKDAFVFSLTRVYNRQDKNNMHDEFCRRGIDFRRLTYGENESGAYPSKIQFIMVTLIFSISQFHRNSRGQGETPSEEQVNAVLAQIEDQVLHGLNLDTQRVTGLDFEALENRAAGAVYQDTEDNRLLKAVAEAVAEAGPWNASMEMVAKRSGLSKSGLYAHFKNKQDMLAKLFITEYARILDFAREQIEGSESPEEQLYLSIITIVNYLRTRPELLVAIDWIRTRRLDLGRDFSGQLYRIIRSIKLEAIRNHDKRSLIRKAHWILFTIVNTLVWWSSDQQAERHLNKGWTRAIAEIPNESFRILFRFIALGARHRF